MYKNFNFGSLNVFLFAFLLSTCAVPETPPIQQFDCKISLLKLDSTCINQLTKSCKQVRNFLYDSSNNVVGVVGIVVENNKYDSIRILNTNVLCNEIHIVTSDYIVTYEKGKDVGVDIVCNALLSSFTITKGQKDTILLGTTFAQANSRIDSISENHSLLAKDNGKDTSICYHIFYSKQGGIELRMK